MGKIKKIFRALTRLERFIFYIALFLFVASGAVLTRFLILEHTEVVPAVGGEYVEGIVGQPTYVNPVLAASEVDKNIVRLIFSSLDEIAEKIEMQENGRLWRVRLKEGLSWSNGRKLTSDDVIFTVEKLQDPQSQSPLFSSWQGVSVSRLSELELRFDLVSPYPFFYEHIRHLYILPKHLFAETPPANWRLSDYNLQPAGSGPYELDAFEKQPSGFISTYRLKPNRHYHGQPPFIPKITFKFFSKTEELLKAFNSGLVDGFAEFEPETLVQINRPHQIIPFSLPSYYAVFMNQGQNLALKEREVREALDFAVDREALVQDLWRGRATAVTDPVPGVVLEEEYEEPMHSREEAAQLLEKAGWKLGENGVREKTIKNTVIPLEFELVVPRAPFLVSTAKQLETAWQAVGVKVTPIVLPAEEVTKKIIQNREYQAILFGNILNPGLDLYPFWHSNERFYPGLNLSFYNNKRADQLLEAIRRNFDPQSRLEQLRELRDVIVSDYPAIFLYSPDYTYIATKELKGAKSKFIAEPSDRFREASGWYLKTTRALK